MKIDKIISASLVATLSCGFAGAFSANAVYTEDQVIDVIENNRKRFDIPDNLTAIDILKMVKGVMRVDDVSKGLEFYLTDEGKVKVDKMESDKKKGLLDLLTGLGLAVEKKGEGMYSIYKLDKDGKKVEVMSASELQEELQKAKNTSTDSTTDIDNTGNGFVISGGSSGSTSTSSSSTSTSTGSTSSNTKVDYGDVGKDNKNKIVQDSGVYKFASEKAGVTRLPEGETNVVFKSTIKDAQAKGMSLVTIAVEGTGKDDDTKTIWALDVGSVDENKIGYPFETKVVVSEGINIINGTSGTGSNLLSAAKINAIQDSAIATDAGAAAELKTDINKKGTKVVDFGKADGDALPCAAAVRVNIADTDKKIKIKVYYICNSRCYRLGNFETDSKGNVVCNFKAESQIGDFVFVPVK